jgi:formate dehydrogenase subunit beta
MKTTIPVENGDVLAAVRGFLARLVETGEAEAIYVAMEGQGGAVVPALVTDAALLAKANPLAPMMPINGARAVSALTGKQAPGRIAAVLRPCEIRALIELVKLQQASLDGLTLIGLDCPGTFEVPRFIEGQREGAPILGETLAAAREGRDPAIDGLPLRVACQTCVVPSADQAAIRLEFFGLDPEKGLTIEMSDDLASRLGYSPAPTAEGRGPALEKITSLHRAAREKEIAAIRSQMNANGGLPALFGPCIRCHNCMTACPICYCKTCLFKSASFDHKPEHYLSAAQRKGALRMLSDTLLFQLTRMNHMTASCVSCGMCTSACPSEIPVGLIFSAVAAEVQDAFGYEPGRSLEDPLPLVTFQANEWAEVGEAK